MVEDSQSAAELHQMAFYRSWTVESFVELLTKPNVKGLKMIKNQTLIGFILWRIVFNEAEILTFIIQPSLQKQGLGSKLLSEFIEILKTNKIKTIFLEVAEDNVIARRFYEKNQFVIIGRRNNYYLNADQTYTPALNLKKEII